MNRHHAPERWQALRYGIMIVMIMITHEYCSGNAFATRIMTMHWEVEFCTASSATELRKIQV